MHGRIDAGLLIPPISDKAKTELDYATVLLEPLIIAAPQGLSSLRGKRQVSLSTLRDIPLIIFPRHIAPTLHDTIMACFHEAGLTPRIAQEAIQMQTIVGLVSAGMGIALVPQSVSNLKRAGVEYKTITGKAPTVETGLAWRRDNRSPVLHAFLELLRKKT
jgi:DNA-binding transcriptional LysR family regulator